MDIILDEIYYKLIDDINGLIDDATSDVLDRLDSDEHPYINKYQLAIHMLKSYVDVAKESYESAYDDLDMSDVMNFDYEQDEDLDFLGLIPDDDFDDIIDDGVIISEEAQQEYFDSFLLSSNIDSSMLPSNLPLMTSEIEHDNIELIEEVSESKEEVDTSIDIEHSSSI